MLIKYRGHFLYFSFFFSLSISVTRRRRTSFANRSRWTSFCWVELTCNYFVLARVEQTRYYAFRLANGTRAIEFSRLNGPAEERKKMCSSLRLMYEVNWKTRRWKEERRITARSLQISECRNPSHYTTALYWRVNCYIKFLIFNELALFGSALSNTDSISFLLRSTTRVRFQSLNNLTFSTPNFDFSIILFVSFFFLGNWKISSVTRHKNSCAKS